VTEFHEQQTLNHSAATPQCRQQHSTDTETSAQDLQASASPAWLLKLNRHTQIPSKDAMQEALNSRHKLTVVSDGGFSDGKGSFGWILRCNDHNIASGYGNAPGTEALHSSFRSEAYGMLAGASFLRHVLNSCHDQWKSKRAATLYCDNRSLVERLQRHTTTPMTLKEFTAPDVDVELQILQEISLMKEQTINITFHHVKGHQDSTKPMEELSTEAKLNIEADRLASLPLKQVPQASYQDFCANHVSLFVDSEPVTAKIKTILRTSHLKAPLKRHLQKQYKWSDNTINNIWWSAHGKAIKNLSFKDRLIVQKFIHNYLPTNHRESKYHEHIEDRCAECGESNEDENHIFTLPVYPEKGNGTILDPGSYDVPIG
jgi:hypothetical protein